MPEICKTDLKAAIAAMENLVTMMKAIPDPSTRQLNRIRITNKLINKLKRKLS